MIIGAGNTIVVKDGYAQNVELRYSGLDKPLKVCYNSYMNDCNHIFIPVTDSDKFYWSACLYCPLEVGIEKAELLSPKDNRLYIAVKDNKIWHKYGEEEWVEWTQEETVYG